MEVPVEVVASHDHLQKDNDAERNWLATPVRWMENAMICEEDWMVVGVLLVLCRAAPVIRQYDTVICPRHELPLELACFVNARTSSSYTSSVTANPALRQRSLQVPWRSSRLLPRQPRVPWRDVGASTVRQNEIRPLPVVGAKCVHSRSLCGFLLSLSVPLSLSLSRDLCDRRTCGAHFEARDQLHTAQPSDRTPR